MHARAGRRLHRPAPVRAKACQRAAPLVPARQLSLPSMQRGALPLQAPSRSAPASTHIDTAFWKYRTRIAMIARAYSNNQPMVNPLVSPLGNINTPPKDPDHWPPTLNYPIPFWILAAVLIYLYLSDLTNSDAKDTAPSEEHKQCMSSRTKWAKHMLSLLQRADLFGITRRDAAFDAFLPEIISDAASSTNKDLRRAAVALILWLSDHESYKSHVRPTVEQVTAMSYTAQHVADAYEATQMIYTVANLFERLTPQQRQEAGPQLVEFCKAIAAKSADDLLNELQLRPIARLVFRLHKQRTKRSHLNVIVTFAAELAAALGEHKPLWASLVTASDPVVSAYGKAAAEVAAGNTNIQLPASLDNKSASIGLEVLTAVGLTAAITPFWARWNTRWYTRPERRVDWMSYATKRSLPAAAVAIPAYYTLRALNSDVLPHIPPERASHTILGFAATALAASNVALRYASPYWIVPSMLSLNASGLSSYHLPFWFRATGHVIPIADDFLREFPVQYHLGFEEKLPVNPLETWYWQAHPPRKQEFESRTAALVGTVKGWFGTPR